MWRDATRAIDVAALDAALGHDGQAASAVVRNVFWIWPGMAMNAGVGLEPPSELTIIAIVTFSS